MSCYSSAKFHNVNILQAINAACATNINYFDIS